jgi:hypothetical protein
VGVIRRKREQRTTNNKEDYGKEKKKNQLKNQIEWEKLWERDLYIKKRNLINYQSMTNKEII